MKNILKCFPIKTKNEIIEVISKENIENKVQEIRVRVNAPIILKINKEKNDLIINYIVKLDEIEYMLQNICDYSIYSFQKEISNGYITIKGGHRVGITGDVVMNENKVINIKHISSLNFRISREIEDCSNSILKYVIDLENNTIFHTLIVSSPGAGKTTLLKDLTRKISDGIPEIGFNGIDVSLIDERGEISAMYNGEPQNKIGIRTDILENITKPIGIKMAIRSMAPKVIIADEIGSMEDIEAVNYAVCSGVKGIFTAHSNNMDSVLLNHELSLLMNMNIIERIIFLDTKQKGKIKSVYFLNKNGYTKIA